MKQVKAQVKVKGFLLSLILSLLVSTEAIGAWAEVGGGTQRTFTAGNSTEDSRGLAFPVSVNTGDFLFAMGAVYDAVDGGPTTATASDTLTTSYSCLAEIGTSLVSVFLCWGVATSSGSNTITVNPAGSNGFISFAIDAFTGAHASPLDQTFQGETGTSTTPNREITSGVANALLLAVMSNATSTTAAITPGGSYTQIGENEDNSCCQSFNAVFRIATTAALYTVDWTIGSSLDWVSGGASFAPSTAVITVAPRHRSAWR